MVPPQQNNPAWYKQISESSFGHRVAHLEFIDTHISRIVLTGPFAYKLKRPVVFDFVDYSTLESRKHFCLAELELNNRYSKDLYLAVVPISIVDGIPVFDCDNDIVDYAVKMKQFDQSQILSEPSCLAQISGGLVDDFARRLVLIHETSERTSGGGTADGYGSSTQIENDVMTNIRFLVKELDDTPYAATARELMAWSEQQCDKLQGLIEARKNNGRIRKCHGDMHLNNLILLNDAITAFDGIEFNQDFQFIDVASDLAFPVMDFVATGKPGLGWRLLNTYVEASNDYQMLQLFNFYFVYRALVRAKVALLSSSTSANPDATRTGTLQSTPESVTTRDITARPKWAVYLTVAAKSIEKPTPRLVITHGFSGSGKSTKALELVEKEAFIRIRTDIIRNSIDFSTSEKYSLSARDHVYRKAAKLAEDVLSAGWNVIVDATFLHRHNRDSFRELAERLEFPFAILNCEAPREVLERRIAGRQNDASEADLEVLHAQLDNHDPLTDVELDHCLKNGALEIGC